MIGESEIKKLALLSRIELTQDEIKRLVADIDAIVSYIADIQKVSADETVRGGDTQTHSLRNDEKPHEKGAYSEILLKEMPQTKENYLKVKKILP